LSTLRGLTTGGAPVPIQLVRRAAELLGVEITILFGQTEASPVMTQTAPGDPPERTTATVGYALPRLGLKIIDPQTGQPLRPGAAAEICGRGYPVMRGYYNMPEATREAIDAEGWLHTGDLATMDEHGYVNILGRLKDMVIRGGENIYPTEIENLLA